MPRYKNAQFQKTFDNMLALAADKASELYWEGEPRRGAGHRASFWDGVSGKFEFTGPRRSAHVIPGTLSAVCFMAGREFARQQKRAAAAANPSRLTMARIDAAVQELGLQLDRESGYFSFWSNEHTDSRPVMVPRLSDLTLEQWVEKAKAAKLEMDEYHSPQAMAKRAMQ